MVTREEFEKKISIKDKQIDNSVLAYKFHDAVIKTFDNLLKEPHNFNAIKNNTEIVTLTNEDIKPKWYPRSNICLEYKKIIKPKSYWNRYEKVVIHKFDLDYTINVNNIIDNYEKYKRMDNYLSDFTKFTSLQSKTFKKRLTKMVYIFEIEKSDRKYRVIFNFLVNYLNLHMSEDIYNFDTKTGKKIEPNKLEGYTNIHTIKNFSKILPPREDRNRKINKILKNNDLVNFNN